MSIMPLFLALSRGANRDPNEQHIYLSIRHILLTLVVPLNIRRTTSPTNTRPSLSAHAGLRLRNNS